MATLFTDEEQTDFTKWKAGGDLMRTELTTPEASNVIMAIFGALVKYLRKRNKDFVGGIVSVSCGAACSVSLTPLVGKTIGWTHPEGMLGLSFLLGVGGLEIVDLLLAKIRKTLAVEEQS